MTINGKLKLEEWVDRFIKSLLTNNDLKENEVLGGYEVGSYEQYPWDKKPKWVSSCLTGEWIAEATMEEDKVEVEGIDEDTDEDELIERITQIVSNLDYVQNIDEGGGYITFYSWSKDAVKRF